MDNVKGLCLLLDNSSNPREALDIRLERLETDANDEMHGLVELMKALRVTPVDYDQAVNEALEEQGLDWDNYDQDYEAIDNVKEELLKDKQLRGDWIGGPCDGEMMLYERANVYDAVDRELVRYYKERGLSEMPPLVNA